MARQPLTPQNYDATVIDQHSQFPSRQEHFEEKVEQLNIRMPKDQATRFKRMAKAERYRHGEFIQMLMDAYEGQAN